MKKAVLFIVFSILFSVSISAQYVFEKVASFSYGNAGNEIGIRKETDGTYGPTGFLNNTGLLYLLDAENNNIKLISLSGKLLRSIAIPALAQDFYINNNTIYVMDINNITAIDAFSSKTLHKEKNKNILNNLILIIKNTK